MEIYKIGMQHYDGKKDKNSGLFELELIKRELLPHSFEKINVIINGSITDTDEVAVEKLLKNGNKNVFIYTDSQCFVSNLCIASRCDLILHQMPKFKLFPIDVPQMYGYVPELFFTGKEKVEYKHNLVLFGGNNLRRDIDIRNYAFNENGEIANHFIVLHKDYSTGIDNRLEYSEYIKLLSLVKYSLVIAREEYYRLGWITSRIVEAYDNFTLPLVDHRYDMYGHFKSFMNYVSCGSYLKSLYDRNFYESDNAIEAIAENRAKISEDREKFKEIVLNV